jgi:cobalt-zinc-cadmium efflux system membrane fusion protein
MNIAVLFLLGLTALGVILAGCGSETGSMADQSAEVDPHAGHDHGPGEHHDQTATTVAAEHGNESDWCAEHRVPESECTSCHPELIAEFKASGDWCAGHDLPESHCRLCNPGIEFPQEAALHLTEADFEEDEIEISLDFRPNAEICATDNALIQFASVETAQKSGLSVQRVRPTSLAASLEAPAEVVFDEARTTVVTTTVSALVSRWLVTPGAVVAQGQALALLQSPEIAELQAKFLSAYAANQAQEKELTRHQKLAAGDLISDADFERQVALTEQTRAELTSARGLLLAAGMSRADVDELLKHREVSNSFPLRAGIGGLLVERIAQIGELMPAGQAFSILADPSAMWIEARLTEEQLRFVKVGDLLTFTADGRGLDRVGGRVIWVSRFLDPHTRTGTVRAEVIDPEHDLHAGEFGRVHIEMDAGAEAVLVPKDAVQWEGCCNVVFVQETVDRYRPRKVRFMQGEGPYYQVTDGVRPGESVVVDGAFLLKTELKKTSLGSGCCGLEPTSES